MNNNSNNLDLDEFSNEEMQIEYQQQQPSTEQTQFAHPQNDIVEILNPHNKDPHFHQIALRPLTWRDQLKVLSDPYQYLVCNVDKKDCKSLNGQMIYAHLLYLMREWSFLSTSQVERVLANRDNDLQSFQFNKQGKVAVIHKSRIILHENQTGQYRKGNEYDQKSIFVTENHDLYQFIAPSYKFSEILIASNRNSLHLVKQTIDTEKNCYGLVKIKEYNGFNAEIGKFSRDGKYFIFSNNISPKLYILDLFCHKIFERNTNQKSISNMSFSRSGLNFLTTCRETNTINVYECVLWEKQQFRFKSPIFFADFLDESQNQEMANCIIVILETGEINIIKDMQFNMLNSANKRINFDFLERQQIVVPQIEHLPYSIIQHVFIDNILFIISEIHHPSTDKPIYGFQSLNLNIRDNKLVTYDSLQIHQNIRFIITPTKQQFIYEITLYNHEVEIDSQNVRQPYFEKVNVNLQTVPQQQQYSQNHIY